MFMFYVNVDNKTISVLEPDAFWLLYNLFYPK